MIFIKMLYLFSCICIYSVVYVFIIVFLILPFLYKHYEVCLL
nr:MAG TPA: hypothetical protein [Caudoviricetes sp.]